MPVWIVYLLLAVLAAAVIAAPLLLAKRPTADDPAPAVAPEEAPPPAGAPSPSLTARFAAHRTPILIGGGVVAVLVAAVALFLATGEPPPPPAAVPPAGASAAGAGLPDVDTMIDRLAKRLEASPNDAEGWRMLGWSYFETRKYPEAVTAYAKAVALAPRDAGFQSAYGEAQVKVAGDVVTPAAEKAFRAALAADSRDERARMYLARLRQAGGDPTGAINDLFAILETAAPDSRAAPAVRAEIRRIASASGVDISGRLPPEPEPAAATVAGPTASDVAAARQLPAEDQQAMIGGMVGRLEARLAASPRDVDGWIMLMRSRKTLGQDDLARAARDKALGVFSDDAAAKARLTAAARDLGVS
ncbi:MAG: tetratricopeptide repeat protein [Caulobacter sp.]